MLRVGHDTVSYLQGIGGLHDDLRRKIDGCPLVQRQCDSTHPARRVPASVAGNSAGVSALVRYGVIQADGHRGSEIAYLTPMGAQQVVRIVNPDKRSKWSGDVGTVTNP